jgi:hypothetical protein
LRISWRLEPIRRLRRVPVRNAREEKGRSASTVEAVVAAAAAEGSQVDDSHHAVNETVLRFPVQDFPSAMGARARGGEHVSRGCFHLHARRSCRAFYSFGTARWQQPIDLGSHSHNKKHPPLAPRSENRATPIQRTVQRAKVSTFHCHEWYTFPSSLTTAWISVDRAVVGQFDDPAGDGGFLNCGERSLAQAGTGGKLAGGSPRAVGRCAPCFYVGAETTP